MNRETTRPADPPSGPALAGIRVLDLSTIVFGPYASQTLADYGAEVIKIEAPRGDGTRYNGPAREPGMSALYLGSNRNKRSLVLDLKDPAAREALLALVDTADVFMHNIRPQALARLGLSGAMLLERNPRLVYVGLHGFGEDGPYAGAPAYDDIIQALSGAADLVLRQSGASGYFPTVAADKISAQMAVQAVMAALFQRERTGRGQTIEVPMFEVVTSFLMVEHFYGHHLETDAAPTQPMGYPRSLDASRRPYRTADGWACIMPYTDENWRRFFEAVERPDLSADTRFHDIAGRARHVADLLALTAAIVGERPTYFWLDLCTRLDIPCARINRLEDLEADPHLRAVGFFQTVEAPGGAPYRFPRFPVRMSDSAVAPTAPPRLGEHTAEILAGLGLAPALLARLTAAGAVADAPAGADPAT